MTVSFAKDDQTSGNYLFFTFCVILLLIYYLFYSKILFFLLLLSSNIGKVAEFWTLAYTEEASSPDDKDLQVWCRLHCTSTRTLISLVSICPGSTWFTLWLEEERSSDAGVGILAGDLGEGAGDTAFIWGSCRCWLQFASWVPAAGGLMVAAGDTRLLLTTRMWDLK